MMTMLTGVMIPVCPDSGCGYGILSEKPFSGGNSAEGNHLFKKRSIREWRCWHRKTTKSGITSGSSPRHDGSHIAHEFNNYMTPVLIYAELLENDDSISSENQEMIHEITEVGGSGIEPVKRAAGIFQAGYRRAARAAEFYGRGGACGFCCEAAGSGRDHGKNGAHERTPLCFGTKTDGRAYPDEPLQKCVSGHGKNGKKRAFGSVCGRKIPTRSVCRFPIRAAVSGMMPCRKFLNRFTPQRFQTGNRAWSFCGSEYRHIRWRKHPGGERADVGTTFILEIPRAALRQKRTAENA